jgi:hypothetical protein
MKKLLVFCALLPLSASLHAIEVSVEACVSAVVTEESSPGVYQGFPEECISFSQDFFYDRDDGTWTVKRSVTNSETRKFFWGYCTNPDVEESFVVEHRLRYDITEGINDDGKVSASVSYSLFPDVVTQGSGTLVEIHSGSSGGSGGDSFCADGFSELTVTLSATSASNPSIFASDSDVNGIYFSPANPGHGFQFMAHEMGFIAFYYGHSSDGERLWLASENLENKLWPYTEYTLRMYEVAEGVFGQPQLPETEWGTATILFYDCANAQVRLDGLDGSISVALEKIVGLRHGGCIKPSW